MLDEAGILTAVQLADAWEQKAPRRLTALPDPR
jgi:hypothetical protein